MRFLSDKQTEVVWDAQAGRALCTINDGALETDDAGLCAALLALGYAHEGEPPAAPVEPQPQAQAEPTPAPARPAGRRGR